MPDLWPAVFLQGLRCGVSLVASSQSEVSGMDDGERSKGWNYEAAGIDWEERAHLAAAVAGKNAIHAQDAEAEVEALRGQLQGAVQDQRAMAQVANAVESLRAGTISTMSAWQAVVDAVDRRGGQ